MNNNPWRTLNSAIQSSLAALLQNISPWLFKGDKKFQDWYDTFYAKKAKKKVVYPEWYFNNALTPDERNSLLCVHAKMEKEQIWRRIKNLVWVGDTGNILFNPHNNSKAFHNFLVNNGYGDWWFASSGSDWDWGVRSRFRGCQLHFRGKKTSDKVEGHIDINNPGDPQTGEVTGPVSELPDAIVHKIGDGWLRSYTHQPYKIKDALSGQGIKVPVVK